MPSPDFAIRIYGERLNVAQRKAVSVNGALLLYVAARADAKSHSAFVNLQEFAVWAACSHRAARRAMDTLEQTGLVLDVKREPHGVIVRLSDVFQRAVAEDITLAVRVYERVFRRRPHAPERDAMHARVGTDAGDLKLWRLVCEQWQTEKHNPADTNALLEVFERRRDAARKVLAGRAVRKVVDPNAGGGEFRNDGDAG